MRLCPFAPLRETKIHTLNQQLIRTQETLSLRVLVRETVQKQAVDELAALPTSHPFKKVVLELLYNFQQNLRTNQNLEPDDRELVK